MSINCIELFAGCGGLLTGFHKAGINHLLAVEMDAAACDTLRKNYKDLDIYEGDINNYDFASFLGKCDIISGGPPCQAFSYAGKRLGFGDIRGTLFSQFARALEEVKPKMFLFENVKGLLTHDSGRTFKTMLHTFDAAGYTCEYKVLDALHYNVAQKRQRIILVGIRKDLADTLKFNFPEPSKKVLILKEALKDCPESIGISYSENKKKVLELVKPGGCWVDLPESVAKKYMGKAYFSSGGKRGMARRLSWDEPCLTLTTSPSQKQTERCHPDKTRPLTVREYARIQSFPDDFEFTGSINQQYKQIGNAVPVNLAYTLGIEIVKTLS